MGRDVFISYSVQDKTIAEAVVSALESRGVQCWIAPRDAVPGMEYAAAIVDAISSCPVFLLILSSASNASPMVAREVERAVSKGVRILTFRIDNTILTKAMEFYLSDRHWMDASASPFEKCLDGLAESVRVLLGQEPRDHPLVAQADKAFRTLQPDAKTALPTEIAAESRAARQSVKAMPARVWALVLGLGLVILAVDYLARYAGSRVAPAGSVTTAPNYAATQNAIDQQATVLWNSEATQNAIDLPATIPAQPAWVASFAQPVLDQIASRPPDFQDDFSDPARSRSVWTLDNGITVADGALKYHVTGTWAHARGPLQSRDFVLKYTLVPMTLIGNREGLIDVEFRWGKDAAHYSFGLMTTNDASNGWGLVRSLADGKVTTLANGSDTEPRLLHKTSVTLIVLGDQIAAYVEDRPIAYAVDNGLSAEEVRLSAGCPDGTFDVDVDDVKFWELAK